MNSKLEIKNMKYEYSHSKIYLYSFISFIPLLFTIIEFSKLFIFN